MPKNLGLMSELPEKNANFVLNEDLFKRIDDFFSKSNRLALCGIDGVGKSEIASEYGHKFKDTSDLNVCKWFDSNSIAKLEINYIESLTKELLELSEILIKENREILLEKVRENLAKSESKFLFIYDSLNVCDSEANKLFNLILKYLPDNVKVLITGAEKNLSFLEPFPNMINVGLFNDREANEFFKNSLNKSRSSEDVNQLIDLFEDGQYLPLNLAKHVSLANHFDSIQIEDLIKKVKEGEDPLVILLKDIFASNFNLSRIIKHISFIDPDFINLELIKMLTGLEDIEDEINKLKELLLIDDRVKGLSIRINHDVQNQMMKYIKQNKDEYESIYLNCMSCFKPLMEIKQSEIIQHGIKMLSNFSDIQKDKLNAENDIVFSFFISNYFENVLVNNRLALEYKKELLKAYEAVFEADSPSIANILNNVALSYQILEEYDEANSYFSKSIAILRKDASQKQNLANILNNMGQNYRLANDLKKAIDLHYEALEINLSSDLINEFKVTETLSLIDVCIRVLDDKEKTIEFFKKQIDILNKIYEPNHPSIGGSYNNLGLIYRSSGEYQKSLESYNKALEIYKKCYQERPHEDIATVFYNIGIGYQFLANYDKSIYYLNIALGLYQKILKPDSQEVIDSLYNLSKCYSVLKNFNKTIEIYNLILSIYNKLEPRNHKEITTILNSLANVYYDMENYESAIEYYKNAADEYKSAKMANEIDSVAFLNSIGNCYYYLEKFKESIDYFKQAFEILNINPEKNSLELGQILSFIGNGYFSLEDYNKAIDYHNKALEIFDKSNTEQSNFEKALVLNSIGNSFYYTKEYAKSIESYLKALELRKCLSGDNSSEIMEILRNIAICFFDAEDYTKSIEYYKELLNMCVKINEDPDNPEVEEIFCHMGDCYNCLKEHKQAIEFYNKALDIKLRVYDSDHPSIGETQNKIGLNYRDIGDVAKARELFGKALEIFAKCYERDHPNFLAIFKNLESLNLAS